MYDIHRQGYPSIPPTNRFRYPTFHRQMIWKRNSQTCVSYDGVVSWISCLWISWVCICVRTSWIPNRNTEWVLAFEVFTSSSRNIMNMNIMGINISTYFMNIINEKYKAMWMIFHYYEYHEYEYFEYEYMYFMNIINEIYRVYVNDFSWVGISWI